MSAPSSDPPSQPPTSDKPETTPSTTVAPESKPEDVEMKAQAPEPVVDRFEDVPESVLKVRRGDHREMVKWADQTA